MITSLVPARCSKALLVNVIWHTTWKQNVLVRALDKGINLCVPKSYITRHDLNTKLNNSLCQNKNIIGRTPIIQSISFQAESFGDPCGVAYFHHATLMWKVHISLLRLPQALFGVISQCLPSSVYYTREWWNSVKVGGRKQVCWIIQYFCDKSTWGI